MVQKLSTQHTQTVRTQCVRLQAADWISANTHDLVDYFRHTLQVLYKIHLVKCIKIE